MLGVYRRGVTDQSESPGHESHRSLVPSFVGSCAQVDEFARPSVSLSLSLSTRSPGSRRRHELNGSEIVASAFAPPGHPFPLRRGESILTQLRYESVSADTLPFFFSFFFLSPLLQEASSSAVPPARCLPCSSLLALTRGSLNASAASVCTSDRLVNHSTPLTRLVDAAKGSSRRFSGYFYRCRTIPFRLRL